MRKIVLLLSIVALSLGLGSAFAGPPPGDKPCTEGSSAAAHNPNCGDNPKRCEHGNPNKTKKGCEGGGAAATCGPITQGLIDADNGLEQIGQPICDLEITLLGTAPL